MFPNGAVTHQKPAGHPVPHAEHQVGESQGLATFWEGRCTAVCSFSLLGARVAPRHASHLPGEACRGPPDQVSHLHWCMMTWMPHRPSLKQRFASPSYIITAPRRMRAAWALPVAHAWAFSLGHLMFSLLSHLISLWKITLLCPFTSPTCARSESLIVTAINFHL